MPVDDNALRLLVRFVLELLAFPMDKGELIRLYTLSGAYLEAVRGCHQTRFFARGV